MSMTKKKDPKKEIEDLKRLREIEAMVQKGDIESAFVSTASKDSETVSNEVADTILNKLESENIYTKDIDNISALTSNRNAPVIKRRNVAKRAVKVATARKAGKPKATQKSSGKKPKKSARITKAGKGKQQKHGSGKKARRR